MSTDDRKMGAPAEAGACSGAGPEELRPALAAELARLADAARPEWLEARAQTRDARRRELETYARAIRPGVMFTTAHEPAECTAATAPDDLAQFDGYDSDGTRCSYSVAQVNAITYDPHTERAPTAEQVAAQEAGRRARVARARQLDQLEPADLWTRALEEPADRVAIVAELERRAQEANAAGLPSIADGLETIARNVRAIAPAVATPELEADDSSPTGARRIRNYRTPEHRAELEPVDTDTGLCHWQGERIVWHYRTQHTRPGIDYAAPIGPTPDLVNRDAIADATPAELEQLAEAGPAAVVDAARAELERRARARAEVMADPLEPPHALDELAQLAEHRPGWKPTDAGPLTHGAIILRSLDRQELRAYAGRWPTLRRIIGAELERRRELLSEAMDANGEPSSLNYRSLERSALELAELAEELEQLPPGIAEQLEPAELSRVERRREQLEQFGATTYELEHAGPIPPVDDDHPDSDGSDERDPTLDGRDELERRRHDDRHTPRRNGIAMDTRQVPTLAELAEWVDCPYCRPADPYELRPTLEELAELADLAGTLAANAEHAAALRLERMERRPPGTHRPSWMENARQELARARRALELARRHDVKRARILERLEEERRQP